MQSKCFQKGRQTHTAGGIFQFSNQILQLQKNIFSQLLTHSYLQFKFLQNTRSIPQVLTPSPIAPSQIIQGCVPPLQKASPPTSQKISTRIFQLTLITHQQHPQRVILTTPFPVFQIQQQPHSPKINNKNNMNPKLNVKQQYKEQAK